MNIDWNLSGLFTMLQPSGIIAKTTAWLVVVLLAWLATGRRRPAIGSAIGNAGLLGLLLLPTSSLLLPTLPIAILSPTEPPFTLRPFTIIVPDTQPDQPSSGYDFRSEPSSDWNFGGFKSGPPAQPTVSMVPAQVVVKPQIRVNALQLLVGAYVLVSLVLLARLIGSIMVVARLRQRSLPVDDSSWLDRLERLRRELGIAGSVALAWSPRVGVPVVIGWMKPLILLPDSIGSEIATDHAEAILLHELAHVRRGDYGWNLLLRVVGAIYWPNPLVWLLSRAIVESRERACDAFCVYQMGGPLAYRSALLAMAEGLTRRTQSPALGLAMARSSRLGRRVRAIDQSPGDSRCVPRRATRLAVLALALSGTACLGPAQLSRATTPAQEPKKPVETIKPLEPVQPVDPARPPIAGKVFRLKVVAAQTGQPIPKADVRVWMGLVKGDEWRQADDQGQLDIAYAMGPDDQHFTVDVWGDGFAMQRHLWNEVPNQPIPAEATVKLQPGESLGGIVQDEQGRPVAGAEVFLWSHNYKKKDSHELLYDLRAITGPDGRWRTGGAPTTTGELLGFYITHPDYLGDRQYVSGRDKPPIAELRAGKAVSVLKKGVPIEGRVLDSDGKPVAGAVVITTDNPQILFNGLREFSVKTDAAGRFRTAQVKPGNWSLVVRASGHAPAIHKVEVENAVLNEEIRLEAPHSFRARVVDPDGQPIAGAFINVDRWRGYRCLGGFLYSDASGWVRWDDAPGDELTLGVDRPGYLGLFQVKAKADTDHTFTLKPALAISGIVRDAETKKGVAKAAVEYGAVDPGTGEVTTWIKPPKLGWVWFADGYLNARFAVNAEAYKIRLMADGYETFVSRAFRRDEKTVVGYDVSLKPGRATGPVGTVVRPDGQPLVGAQVYQDLGGNDLALVDGKLGGVDGGRKILTGADGSFTVQGDDASNNLLIVGDDSFAFANAKTLVGSPQVQARRYGRLEGRYLVGSQPWANRPIELQGSLLMESSRSIGTLIRYRTTTDADGKFAFDKVIPIPGYRVLRNDPQDKQRRFWSLGVPVKIEDGRTTVATIGGQGRAIIGRIEPPEDWKRPVDFASQGKVILRSNLTNVPYPMELFRGKTSLEDQGWMDWYQAWRKTVEGQTYIQQMVSINVTLAPDGSFRIDDVPSGEYRVEIDMHDDRLARNVASPFVSIDRTIAIPPMPGGRSDDPLDLGTIRLKLRSNFGLKVGDLAPAFEVATVEGKKPAVPGDFRGKFLLLDLGTLWDMQSRLQVVRMNEVFARFGKEDRFAMLSLLMAADGPESRKFVAEKGESWPQAIVGPIANPIAEAYAIEANQFPATILIGPDGRVVARDLYGPKIGESIAQALGIKEPVKAETKPRDPDAVDKVEPIQ